MIANTITLSTIAIAAYTMYSTADAESHGSRNGADKMLETLNHRLRSKCVMASGLSVELMDVAGLTKKVTIVASAKATTYVPSA